MFWLSELWQVLDHILLHLLVKSHLGFLSSQVCSSSLPGGDGPCHFPNELLLFVSFIPCHRNLSQPLTINSLSPESFTSSSYILIQQVSVWSPNQQHAFSGLIPDLLNQTLAWSPVILLDQPSSWFWSRPASEHQSASEFHLLKNCTTTPGFLPYSHDRQVPPGTWSLFFPYSICFRPY